MILDIKCDYCNKTFQLTKTIYNKRLKKNSHIYCSQLCAQLARTTKQSFICIKCGKSFLRCPTRIQSNNIFCSKSCANSYNNRHKRKETQNTYRRIAFEHYEHKCHVCGWCDDDRVLEVHHIDEDRTNNDVTNLIILCPICHSYISLHIYTLHQLMEITKKNIIL